MFIGMIRLTRLNQKPLVVNSDLIEHVESTPDTIVTMTTGQKFVVQESAEEVVDRVIGYRRTIGCCPPRLDLTNPAPTP